MKENTLTLWLNMYSGWLTAIWLDQHAPPWAREDISAFPVLLQLFHGLTCWHSHHLVSIFAKWITPLFLDGLLVRVKIYQCGPLKINRSQCRILISQTVKEGSHSKEERKKVWVDIELRCICLGPPSTHWGKSYTPLPFIILCPHLEGNDLLFKTGNESMNGGHVTKQC